MRSPTLPRFRQTTAADVERGRRIPYRLSWSLVALVTAVVVVAVSFTTIWVLNTLFALAILYTPGTLAAALIFAVVISDARRLQGSGKWIR